MVRFQLQQPYSKDLLAPYLLAFVIEDITRHIQGELALHMLFGDDIILIDENGAGINYRLELWRER